MNTMTERIRKTKSVCPVCLKSLPAVLTAKEDGIYLQRSCPEHGFFEAPVWRNKVDFGGWISREQPLSAEELGYCSGDCRACSGHRQGSCCVILEVTNRCSLSCAYCFAHGGEEDAEPLFDEVCRQLDSIMSLAEAPLVQLSGGEPTLRDDLPELVAYARKAGCSCTQVNTNGIRLAEDEAYVRRLAEAGLDIVFLQFDGTDDGIYRKLRGRDLLHVKEKAIENCGRYHIGVTLVPTVVKGINDAAAGSIVRYAAAHFPAVRAVHFQPVTYLGRYPADGEPPRRCTLDELIADIAGQTGLPKSAFLPSRCDHALCEFHAVFMLNDAGQLAAMTDRAYDLREHRSSPAQNRSFVACHWSGKGEAEAFRPEPAGASLVCADPGEMDFDTFIKRMRSRTITISAMAFQDAMNLDLERLCHCSLHVYENGRLLPFCCRYLTGIAEDHPCVSARI